MSRFLCAGVMALVFATHALADSQLKLRPGMMGVANIGASDCALFNEMHPFGPNGLQHQVLIWTQGYLFASSRESIDTLLARLPEDNGWDFDTLSGVFIAYCADNPDAKVSDAAMLLAKMLSEGRSAPRP